MVLLLYRADCLVVPSLRGYWPHASRLQMHLPAVALCSTTGLVYITQVLDKVNNVWVVTPRHIGQLSVASTWHLPLVDGEVYNPFCTWHIWYQKNEAYLRSNILQQDSTWLLWLPAANSRPWASISFILGLCRLTALASVNCAIFHRLWWEQCSQPKVDICTGCAFLGAR